MSAHTVKAAKDAVRRVLEMTYQSADDYLMRAQESLNWHDTSDGRHLPMKQFLTDNAFKPDLETYNTTRTG